MTSRDRAADLPDGPTTDPATARSTAAAAGPATALPAALLSTLEEIVGPGHLLRAADLRAPFEVDWTGRWRGEAGAVVRPGDTAEVARVLALCDEHGVVVVPQGGNTGLVGGGVPRDGALVLSLTRLDQVGAVVTRGAAGAGGGADTAGEVVVGAGASLAAVQVRAREAGLLYPVDLAARDTATIGGTIATDAGGLAVVRHGPTRAQVLGLEAVLVDGTLLDRLHPPRAAGLGYDLAGLLVGSEGTLAVVTAARLRLVRPPRHLAVAVVATDGIRAALEVQRQVAQAVGPLEASELMTRAGLSLVAQAPGVRAPFVPPPPAALLVEVAGAPDVGEALSATLAEVVGHVSGVQDAVVGIDAADRAALWQLREAHTERLAARGVALKLDVVLPPAGLAGFIEGLEGLVRDAGGADAEVVVFGHLGVGDLHCNVVGVAPAQVPAVEQAVLGSVVAAGGSPCGEHGVGRQKPDWLARVRPAGDVAALHAVKRAFDPRGILNPGVLLPGSLPGQQEGSADHLVEDQQGQGPA